MQPKLQIALDVWSLEEAFAILADVAEYVDIIEAGTPLVVNQGISSLKAIKDKYPNKEFTIDAKITDEFYIAQKAFDAGADYTTVLGILSDEAVSSAINEGKKAGKEVMVDLMNVRDKLQRAQQVKEMGAHYVIVHYGLDEQRLGKTPLEDLKTIKQNTDIKIAVAGGINLDTLPDYLREYPDIIIVGKALVENPNRKHAAEQMRSLIEEDTSLH